MENLLEFKDVSYSYSSQAGNVEVLKQANYSFVKGKVYAIVGPSGSGKTTTIVLAGGLDQCKEGQILYKNENLKKIGLNQYRCHNISIVFQSYNLIYYMNALDNVMNAINIAKIKVPNKKEYCLNILEQLGLSRDECLRDIRKLSGGQQQRVAIARAIAKDVDLILADEPTGNLDENNSQEIMNKFVELAHQDNKCVIIVTHSNELAAKCDVQLRIHEGQIEEI